MTNQKPLILLALNEINFEIARQYVDGLDLRGFRAILSGDLRSTSSEVEYEELEPWIQWVSAQTGQTAREHGIFRLGDIVSGKDAQFFEQIEAMGKQVGAVCPMNAENRLSKPAFFIPDPWTKTPSDGGFWSRHLTKAVAQAVNDNSEGKLTAASALVLALGVLRFARPRNYRHYAKLALRSRQAPWRKALFLDLFLNDLHQGLRSARKPHFSMLFLNAGAHIQHHYMLNSRAVSTGARQNPSWYIGSHEDPMAEMFVIYDSIIREYLEDKSINLILATGLRQVPYTQATFYYRLRDPANFLNAFGIRPAAVLPRMTRDCLLEFSSEEEAAEAQQIMQSIVSSVDQVPLFEEIDNRGQSLFVTLTYPNEITGDTVAEGTGRRVPLLDHTVFVAIKNGKHDPQGYVYCQGEVAKYAPDDGDHVKNLHSTVMNFFGENNPAQAK
ncbi:MAG: hypothetical protein CMN65_05145 [Sphingomonadaceae bacterium]|nr:hypothetical protein [Sphingomonadaceae bacterium]